VKNEDIRYRCNWCNYVLDENYKIIKNEIEQKKYKDSNLTFHYCEECYQTLLKEINYDD